MVVLQYGSSDCWLWGLCLHNRLSVHWLGLCLLLGLSDFWLGDMFGIGFVCLFVGGYVMTRLLTLGMM